MRSKSRLVWSASILTLAVALAGCNATSGGGGGGSGGGGNGNGNAADPLPSIQLGQDPELDANVGAITRVENEALACMGSETVFTDEEVLADLKTGYTQSQDVPPTFEEFVADVVPIEQSRRDQICDLNIGDDEALDAAIGRITEAANRLAECTNGEPTAIDEDSLSAVKALFFNRGITQTDLVAFAQEQADLSEQRADDDCAAAQAG